MDELKGSGSPPTRRVIDALEAVAATPHGLTASELARHCGMSTSTCALVLAELERSRFVDRDSERRYFLASGLFTLVQGLRSRFPLLDIGRSVLDGLHIATGASCSLTRIEADALVVVDISGYRTDEQIAVGRRFPLDPPYGSVAMAFSGRDEIGLWLRNMTPRLTPDEIDQQVQVCADIRNRGFGAWKLDESQPTLRDRLTELLDSAVLTDATDAPRQRISKILNMVSLTSVTAANADGLRQAEFIVAPVFARSGPPHYQIEVRIDEATRNRCSGDKLEMSIREAAERLTQYLKKGY